MDIRFVKLYLPRMVEVDVSSVEEYLPQVVDVDTGSLELYTQEGVDVNVSFWEVCLPDGWYECQLRGHMLIYSRFTYCMLFQVVVFYNMPWLEVHDIVRFFYIVMFQYYFFLLQSV